MSNAVEQVPSAARAARLLGRLPAAAAALLVLLAPVASAQIGDSPAGLLAGVAAYEPQPTESGAYVAASDFVFELDVEGDTLVSVSGAGTLNDANIRFIGSLLGAASGYADALAAPVADFFRTNVTDLAGEGRLVVEVLEYLMWLDVSEDQPAHVEITFEPATVPEELFGEPAYTLGPDDATYVIREFTDLQCPYCALFAAEGLPVVRELVERGDVRFEIHHFPLKSIHPNAVVAAEAAECVAEEAGMAGAGAADANAAFFTFTDALFERQDEWAGLPDPLGAFQAVATDLGLSTAGLNQCVRTGRFSSVIEASYQNAVQTLRLTGTPTVFVDGLKLADYADEDAYLRLFRLSDALQDL